MELQAITPKVVLEAMKNEHHNGGTLGRSMVTITTPKVLKTVIAQSDNLRGKTISIVRYISNIRKVDYDKKCQSVGMEHTPSEKRNVWAHWYISNELDATNYIIEHNTKGTLYLLYNWAKGDKSFNTKKAYLVDGRKPTKEELNDIETFTYGGKTIFGARNSSYDNEVQARQVELSNIAYIGFSSAIALNMYDLLVNKEK